MLRYATSALLVGMVAFAAGQTTAVTANKLAHAPSIDGKIDDSEWIEAASFEGLVDRTNGQTSPEGGKFWLGYDEKYVYFAARLNDSQPGSIRATEYRTNVTLQGDDTVLLGLDLSGSLSDFSTFEANPRGATSISLAGGRAVKREWTGEIQAQGRVTPSGWELEMRIPWSILPVPKAGPRDARFIVNRYIPRLNRNLTHVFVDSGQLQKIPIWRGVVLPKPYVDRSIKLLPYGYAGAAQDRGAIVNGGLDMKTSLADQIHLVGTVNPDFRNIENSILSLDFSRFARIANENRPFFQEGAEYYNSAIFASQLIRRFDAGLNVYGKLDDRTQFGILDTNDFGDENSLIGNFTYAPTAVDNYRLSLTQLDRRTDHNSAYLARYSRDFGPWNLFLRDMGSQDSQRRWGQNSSGFVSYNKAGLSAGLGYTRVTPNFAPALGYFPEVDFKGWDASVSYNRPFVRGPLQRYSLNAFYTDYDRTSGRFYRTDMYTGGTLVTRNDIAFSAYLDQENFEGSHDHTQGGNIRFPGSNPYRSVTVGYDSGRIGGQEYRLQSLNGAYRLLGRLQLTGSFQRFHLGPNDNEQTIFGGNYDLGGDRSLSGRLVRTGSNTNWYAAYRRSGNRGAEYYLILGDPSALRFHPSLILKVVVPFRV